MQCPSCHHQATSLLRNAFTFQGVSFIQSFRGFLKCQHCGKLLMVTSYGKYFWYFYIPVLFILLVFTVADKYINNNFHIDAGILWVALVIMICITFTFGIWRNARVEDVHDMKMRGRD
jgi:hypothetical protein